MRIEKTIPHIGFTLVELLVVLAIISLLVVLVFPAISGGLESGREVVCASNMRQYGISAFAYSMEHRTRWPGLARSSEGTAMIWSEILANENYLPVNKRYDADNRSATLYCPSKRKGKQIYARSFQFNWDASGAAPSDTRVTGPLGLDLIPPPAGYSEYRLGAFTTACKKPSSMFLAIETERHADYCKYQSGIAANPELGVDAAFPKWSSTLGIYAFRHKKRQHANFLFFDTHVQSLNVNDEEGINTPERFSL